jgi:NAD(P)H-flavin reductase
MVPAVVQVRDFHPETADTFTLALEPPSQGFSFLPGQFNMLYVFGVGEAAISMSGDPTDTGPIRHTIRAVGSVTSALAKMRTGNALGVRGPFGSAWPVEAARGSDVILVAGGIGLAPLRPAICHLLRHRSDYGRVVLFYGARSPGDLLYTAEFEQWRKNLELLITVDKGDASWRGSIGLVTKLFLGIDLDPRRTIAMVCGPEVMMRFVQREFEKRGMGDDRVYVSLERNMQCAIGFCGHCQFGPDFVCMDGPVFRYDRIRPFFNIPEA